MNILEKAKIVIKAKELDDKADDTKSWDESWNLRQTVDLTDIEIIQSLIDELLKSREKVIFYMDKTSVYIEKAHEWMEKYEKTMKV